MIVGRLAAWLAFAVFRYRRAHVSSAIARAGIARAHVATRAVYENLGLGLCEWLGAWLFGKRALRNVALTPATRAELERARARGPVIIAASHTGNWELAAYHLAELVPVTMIAKPLHVRWLHVWCMHVRTRFGLDVVVAKDGDMSRAPVLALEAALRAGRVVVVASDQVPEAEAHGTRASFLGADAWLDRTAYALAARARATVLVTAQRRTARGHEIVVLRTISTPALNRGAWITEATREGARALEAFVRETPGAWLWTHRRWRACARVGARAAWGFPEAAEVLRLARRTRKSTG